MHHTWKHHLCGVLFLTMAALAALSGACGDGSSISASSGAVVLNEIHCHDRDWVEMVNATQAEVDMSNWAVADDLTKDGHQYAIPEGTLIQPGEHLVVRQEQDLESGFTFGLKCGEDTVYLVDDAGDVVDQVDIAVVPEDLTFGHLPDITGLWRETAPTEGYANQAPATE